MMNPQYPPPGNNNAPINPLGFQPSQDHNGVHNANIYSQMPPNGQQMDMSQKMHNLNLNGPQPLSNIPPSQLPPGQLPSSNFPPTSNYSGQLPPGVNPPTLPGRPPGSNSHQIPSMNHNYVAPSSTPGSNQPGYQPPTSTQGLPASLGRSGPPEPSRQTMPTQMSAAQGYQGQPANQAGMPTPPHIGQPGQFGLKQGSGQIPNLPLQPQGPPTSQPGIQPKPLLTSQQPGAPPQTQQKSFFGQPGVPPQPGLSQPALLPQSQAGFPPQHGLQQQPGISPQQGPSKHSQPGVPPQSSVQPGMPPKQGMPLQSGMSPNPGMSLQPGMPLHPGILPQPAMPSQSLMPLQPGMPPQPNMPPQPVMPPRSANQSHPSIQSQQGMPPQPSMPPQQSMSLQPGMPPQQVMPPQQGMPTQQGMQPSQFNQYQTMAGLPHMPPPLNQQIPYQQPGFVAQPVPQANMQYSGMPPQQGYQQGYQFPAQQPSYAAPPQKRLDPDQMPSPIQVMQDDQQNRGGVFVTNDKGLVPPLVTTDFVVDDKGNSSPRYIRSSMYSVPVTMDLLKQTAMPFCLVISPMAETVGTEQEPPLLDFAALTGSPTMGPVRCCRCKAYMCPNMKFIDGGRHFKCAFCKATSEVPMEYTQYITSMQQYGRAPAEMALGTYEIVATKEYCRNNTLPNPPAVVFVIDVSYNSIKSGMLQTVCDNILEIIESMPKDEQTGKCCTRVGFITYSTTVQFYNIKGSLAQPQMLSVGDTADMFVPLLEGFLQCAEDSGPVLRSLLALLPTTCRAATDTETVLLPAVQAGYEALKAADTAGQLLVFHTTLPTYNAPGKLINREDRKVLGTDKEKQILSPQSTAYNELGQLCSAAGVCVQLFLCNNSYIDCATLGQLPRLTGGQVYKYTYFTAETDGSRLVWDVSRVLLRPTAHDAVMRVRTSTGVRATDFYGHFFMSNTTDVELAAIDSDKAIGVEIKHDDKLTGEQGVFVQAALLYTHRSGQRRLRVLNLALALAQQLADVYRSAELDTMVNFLTKQAVWALREAPPRAVREGLTARCARSLAAYRRHCASPSSSGQLVLPEAMKLLPLYTSCILRGDAVAGGPDITCDDRSCAMYRALTADVSLSLVYTYPRLLALHALPDREPTPLRASMDKMSDQGVYLLENGVHMLIWVGSQAPVDFVRDVFGVSSPQAVDARVCELPHTDTRAGAAVRRLLEDARRIRKNAMRLSVVPQHDKLEYEFRRTLVEDKGPSGSESYVEHLMTTHKLVQKLL